MAATGSKPTLRDVVAVFERVRRRLERRKALELDHLVEPRQVRERPLHLVGILADFLRLEPLKQRVSRGGFKENKHVGLRAGARRRVAEAVFPTGPREQSGGAEEAAPRQSRLSGEFRI